MILIAFCRISFLFRIDRKTPGRGPGLIDLVRVYEEFDWVLIRKQYWYQAILITAYHEIGEPVSV